MKIPFFSKKKQKTFYLGVFLKEDRGILMIFLKESDSIELVDREKFSYTNGWENLIDDVDEALYRLEKNLDVEIKKTIIFIYSHLVDEKTGDIKPVYLNKIKQLVKALELQVMGYVECFEAISFYLEKSEQISLTAILIEIDKTQLGIFIYKNGKIDSKKILARTDSIIADLSEGFKEIKKKIILPARIILYDSDNLDDTATKIISHRWSSDYFVQMPKVDILSEDEVINGLMGIFGEQLKDKTTPEKEIIDREEKRETFGFLLNQDVSEKAIFKTKTITSTLTWKVRLNRFFDKLKTLFPNKNPIQFKMNYSGKFFPIVGVMIIFVSFFINEYFFHLAKLTVYLPAQKFEKTVKIESDFRLASASADFSETINTSGEQEVGNKARGQVTIYNSNLSSTETLQQKTSIISPNNLKYTLESEVKIASASGDASSLQPATAKVSVVAEAIGEQYNLTGNIKFTIEGKSKNLLAKNDSAFSGGNKKQISTVAKKDQENLKQIILNKAKKEIPSIKILPDEIVASSLSNADFSKINFSKEIGEESGQLNLKATVLATHFLFNKNGFLDKALILLKPEIKEQYQLEKQNISFTISNIDKKDNQLIMEAKLKAKAVIKISDTEIKRSVLGKNQSKLREILKSQYKIDGYNLIIKEPLSLLKNYLPFFLQNISLKNSSL